MYPAFYATLAPLSPCPSCVQFYTCSRFGSDQAGVGQQTESGGRGHCAAFTRRVCSLGGRVQEPRAKRRPGVCPTDC